MIGLGKNSRVMFVINKRQSENILGFEELTPFFARPPTVFLIPGT
jgi:hypothetical protein